MSHQDPFTQELELLDVDEILGICYGLRAHPARIRMYLNILRKRGGVRAQFGCCLLAYDLARQGDKAMAQEFSLLANTLRHLMQDTALVDELVGTSDYLRFVWDLCLQSLQESEEEPLVSSFSSATSPSSGEVELELDLFDETELASFDVQLDPNSEALWRQFNKALSAFLGIVDDGPMVLPQHGFKLGADAKSRLASFIQHLVAIEHAIPPARGFLAFARLFLADNMRSKSLFGQRNKERDAMLEAGLDGFIAHGEDLWQIAAVLDGVHADAKAWPKVVARLYDFVSWLAQQPPETESIQTATTRYIAQAKATPKPPA